VNKPDWFKFYPSKWLASKAVLRMSPAGRGAYMSLLCEAWSQTPPGSVPDDDGWLAEHASVTAKVWAKVSAEVRKAFVKSEEDGRLYQPFMAGPIAQAAYGKSEKAKAAANKRWHPPTDAYAMQTHSECNAGGMPTQCHQEREGEEERESEGEERVSAAVAAGIRGEVQERGAEAANTFGMSVAQLGMYSRIVARPVWLPEDREWIDHPTARRLALRSTSTPAHVAYWLDRAKARRKEVRDVNLAGFVIGKLDKPDMALVEALATQEAST